jgi:hypothetical protein
MLSVGSFFGRGFDSRRLVPVLVAGHPASRIAPCSALGTLPRLRIAPYTMLGVSRRSRIAPCSTLLASTPSADCSVLDVWPSVPVYGLLRTLTLRARGLSLWIAPRSTLSSAPPQITLCPMLDALFRLRIAPLSSLRIPVSAADRSVPNTLSFASNPDRSVFYTYRSAPNVNYSMFDT